MNGPKLSEQERNLTMAGLIVFGVLGRVLPHLTNFAPVGGISIFSGSRITGWRALAIPLVIMFATGPMLGYGPFNLVMLFVYGSFLVNVALGRWLLQSTGPLRIAAVSLLCSCQFFVVTNFGLWVSGISYPLTLSGLATCYIVGIPFFGRTILADLFYVSVLFGLGAWLRRKNFLPRSDQPRVMTS